MYIDNQAAMAMINESRPTPRARHIEIQHFAIQQWSADLYMKFIPGVINSSDGLTKPLGWVLHSRHARRGMGHYNLGSPETPQASESGRVLEPKIDLAATEQKGIYDQDQKGILAEPGMAEPERNDPRKENESFSS